ncbi:hypothetical protein H9L39_00462 [Fusarium oxysporum f. sp. albedinis]|nr:hypothetical protein H9L39_00462 [Fusarium oxysporum f. sp. albedinis]
MGGLIRESQNLQRLFPPFTTRPPYSRVGEVHTLRYIEEGAKRLGVSPCHGSYTGAYNDALFYLLYDVAFASPSFHPLNNSRRWKRIDQQHIQFELVRLIWTKASSSRHRSIEFRCNKSWKRF